MKTVLTLTFVVSISMMSWAATQTVCASGCDFTTISAAISGATAGDVIEIRDATHTEANISITKNLTIRGLGQTTTTVQANANQANAEDGVFKILTIGLTVTFQDMTIQNGYAKTGGSSTLENGGGVRISCDASTNISFENVTITNNKCNGSRGGGVYITGSAGTVSFLNCVISNNEAEGSHDGGGLANLGATTLTLTKCTISDNVAGDDGGGIYVSEDGGTNKFINCTMYNNAGGGSSADEGRGGCMYLTSTANYEFYNCTIVNNSLNTIADRRGAGIYQTNTGDLSLTNTIVANNSGATTGNDIYASSTGTMTQTTSLVEDCANGSGECPQFSYFGDPNLSAVATCGVQSYFAPASRSFISDNGTAPVGDIPTDDICGTTRSVAKYDIGSYDDAALATGLITTATDIEAYFSTLISYLPDTGLNTFAEPTAGNLTTWTTIIDNLLADNTTTANTNAATIDYEVVLFTDNSVMPTKQYYLLQKESDGGNHWGTYVFNPSPCREIIIEAPHPVNDFNTGKQGVYCLKNTNARAFLLAGTHRCNQKTYSSCDGQTTTCAESGNNENFRLSDLAHNSNNCFQTTSDKLHDDIGTSVIVQLHGFSKEVSDPYVILSNGTELSPSGTDYTNNFKTQLAATDGTLTFEVAHIDSWTRLIGTTNTQGRYINGQVSPCNNAAVGATGRFIHLEQEKTKLRDDETGWAKVSTALGNLVTCVLPVELTFFKGKLIENDVVQLNWQTASEHNNHSFDIQKSKNGQDWKHIGTVGGNHTLSSVSNYQFYDVEPFKGNNYYRLKQVDFDGQFEYSSIIHMNYELGIQQDKLEIYPNPVQYEMSIMNLSQVLGDGAMQATIYNILGQPVKEFQISNAEFIIQVSDLPQGQYILCLQQVDGKMMTKSFIK